MESESIAMRRIEVNLPRPLRTIGRGAWGLQQAGVTAVLLLALPLLSRIGLVIPGVPGWLALLAWVVAIPWFLTRRFRVSARDLQDSLALVRAGDMEAAQPQLAGALARASGPLASNFALMLGAVEIELGRTEHGLAILESARRSRWLDSGVLKQSRGALYAAMATGYAVLGDQASADHALAIAKRELPPNQRGLLLADEVFVLARAGRHAEAHQAFTSDVDPAEQLLPAWSIKWIRVVHAYSRAAAGSDYRMGADEDVRGLLADARVRRSVVRLGHGWPEFRAFLAAHGVAG